MTPETGSAVPLALVVPAAVVPMPTPTPTPTASPSPVPTTQPTPPPAVGGGTTPASSTGDTGDTGGAGTGGALAYTGADVLPEALAAGVLVLLGAGLLTSRAVRNRRRTDHLQD